MGDQRYTRWFTDWPSTHINAGQTVEVMPVAEHERLIGPDLAALQLEAWDVFQSVPDEQGAHAALDRAVEHVVELLREA